jgi:hypothetical protein
VIRIRTKQKETETAWKTYVAKNGFKNMEEALRALLVEKGFLGPDLPRTFLP